MVGVRVALKIAGVATGHVEMREATAEERAHRASQRFHAGALLYGACFAERSICLDQLQEAALKLPAVCLGQLFGNDKFGRRHRNGAWAALDKGTWNYESDQHRATHDRAVARRAGALGVDMQYAFDLFSANAIPDHLDHLVW